MDADQKFGPIRKGLLEFLVLRIVSGSIVYVADILRRLADSVLQLDLGGLKVSFREVLLRIRDRSRSLLRIRAWVGDCRKGCGES